MTEMHTRALGIAAAALVALSIATVPRGAAGANPAPKGPLVQSIDFDLTINPASAEWAKEALDQAKDKKASLVIFRLDTPGGLDDSMRKIIKRILAAPMPVVVYVSPNGARAASAGLYITEAADVAAMAPQTNIGSATPISLGGVSLILALFGLAQLPINVAGLLLILLAFGLFVAEAFITSHGALAIGGVVSLVFGGLLLFNTNNDAYEISVPIVIFTAALLGSFFAWVIGKAVQARHREVHTGSEELLGKIGTVRSPLDPVGHVFVNGALWRARTRDDSTLDVGEQIVVEEIQGLTLTVAPMVRGAPAGQQVE
jgi:membrane-bound ClpP family serine protease